MGFVLVYSPKCVFLVEIIKSGFKIAFCYTTQFLVSFFCKLQKASFQKEQQNRLSQNEKVLKCCAPEAFSGVKFQVLMENSNKKWVGKG